MFGWLYKGIAKAVFEEAEQRLSETLQDPDFQENMLILIDSQVDRQKQRMLGSVGAMVRDQPQMITPQPNQALPDITTKDGEIHWGKVLAAIVGGQIRPVNPTQGGYQKDRKVYKYQ